MSVVFVDTSFLIALEVQDDGNHPVAKEIWERLLENPLALVSTTYIFDEVVTFFNARNPKATAASRNCNCSTPST